MNTQNPATMPEGISGIERNGVDTIPEDQRHSTPFNFGLVWVGAQFSFNLIVLGWLPVSFGLGWWSALSAITVGLIIGTAIYAPFGLFGPRTGTNSAVSSGAHFGVVGRLIGTCLSLFIALGFFGLVIWTGGDSLVLGLNKLFGTDAGDGVRALGYAVMGAITLSLAVYGHDKVVASQKWVTAIIGVVLLLGLFALGGKFDAGYQGGEYLLGGFWATWVLGVVTGISAPISYAPFVNDYSRYISPKRFTQKQVLVANTVGMFFGCWTVMAFGAFEGTLAPIELGPVGALVEASPMWYVIPVIMIGTIGTLAQGALCLYGTGLDTSSLIPKLPRPAATLLLGLVGIAVVFLGAFVFNAIDLINAFVILLTVVTSPWIIINLIGYWSRRGWYDPADLQVFNRGEKGGRYWFTMGWNLRAMCAWVPAVFVGLMCAQTTKYTGPWADVASGVDVSIISAMVIGGVIYTVLLKLYPEGPEVRGYVSAAAESPSVAGAPGDVVPEPSVVT
jgi:purine-cytosine permease-like protein